jgi:hypothetical protein
MSKSRDPLLLGPHWHVDCSLDAELPDDRVVSSRFLVNLPFGMATLVLLILFGWNLYKDLNLHFDIASTVRRIADSRVEVASIRQMQLDYIAAASKIELAHKLVRSRLFVYQFTTELGRTRPEQMVINSIESSEVGVVVRGTLGESSERATLLISKYVDQLAKDPEIGPHFKKEGINVTAFESNPATHQQNFEITFQFGPNPS